LVALLKPLSGSISRHDSAAVFRVSVMMITSFLSMVVFVKSFIDARLRTN
jgi:hypothetical protein